MVTKVVLAKLSPTMEEGTIVKWSKNEGDPVKVGDVLAEIETDKANMEMEALGAGVLRKVLVPAGGKAPVGALIGVIADPGDEIEGTLAAAQAAPPPAQASPAAQAQPAASATPAAPPVATPQPAPAPAAPTLSAPLAAPTARPIQAAAARLAASAVPAPSMAAPGPEGRVKASPLARSIAAAQNISLAGVAGSGPGGRVIKRDVEAIAAGAAPRLVAAPAPVPSAAPAIARGPAPAPAAPAPTVVPGQALPLSNMRRTIARRLSESKFTAPHFYVTVEIDMDAAVALREQLLRGENVKVSYNDLVVKACAKALTRFPTVNASWSAEAVVTHAEVHVGVAVAIADGLIVPVVRNADRKSVLEIAAEVKELAARARDRKLRPEEFSGSTFSVSNLGMMDVTEFTAIINPPESAILAVGAVRKQPVVTDDDRIRIGHRMKVTLSSDHRAIDGALAASFLGEVRRLLENPVSLFV
jgi:pyruvate dehydrogenase E2 component (dihydrolipoamide acetyltransferase)